jgi:hypothetical protein
MQLDARGDVTEDTLNKEPGDLRVGLRKLGANFAKIPKLVLIVGVTHQIVPS